MPDTEETDYAVEEENSPADRKEADEEREIVDDAAADTENGEEQTESPVKTVTSGKRIEIIPAQKADIPKRENESGRALTAEELQSLDELIQQNGNYGFLLSAYDTPADTDFNKITATQLNDFLLEKIGEEIPLADVSFSIIKDGWEITRLYGEYSENAG